jgi:hypothetical protein
MPVTNNADASRLGQINKAGDDKALFLKKFSGEVLTTFETNCVMKDKQLVKTIESGKSAQFPVTGTAAAAYHTPGRNILEGDNGLLSKIGKNERVISIDGLLTASAFVANIDEAMNHYDTRSVYTTEVGLQLAYAWDRNSLQASVLAARAAASITGGKSGTVLNRGATVATTGAVLAAAIFAAARSLDEKDVPENDRYAVVRPEHYYLLAQTTDVINKDWGGSGVYAEGKVLKVAGIHIVKSNHLPNSVVAADPNHNNTYSGDFSNTVCLVFQKGAIGTVKLLDLATESDYLVTHQGTLIVSKYAVGTGILRPECAVEITKV